MNHSNAVTSVIYQQGDYAETLIARYKEVQVIECKQGDKVALYRIEWVQPDGYRSNEARYTVTGAFSLFIALIAPNPNWYSLA